MLQEGYLGFPVTLSSLIKKIALKFVCMVSIYVGVKNFLSLFSSLFNSFIKDYR